MHTKNACLVLSHLLKSSSDMENTSKSKSQVLGENWWILSAFQIWKTFIEGFSSRCSAHPSWVTFTFSVVNQVTLPLIWQGHLRNISRTLPGNWHRDLGTSTDTHHSNNQWDIWTIKPISISPWILVKPLWDCRTIKQTVSILCQLNNHDLISKSLSFLCLTLTFVRPTNITANIFLVPLSSNST